MLTVQAKNDHSLDLIDQPIKPKTSTDFALVVTKAGELNIVTRHKINDGILGKGKPVNGLAILESVVASNTQQESPNDNDTMTRELLPNTILFDSSKSLVWYQKAQLRTMWFNVKRTLQVKVWWPAVLFILDRHSQTLYVFALATNARPTMDSKLYRAPFMNISSNGNFCLGGATLPTDLSAFNTDQMEQCLYESNFTHLNDNDTSKKLFSTDVEHLKFWRNQQKTASKVKVATLPFVTRLRHINFK